MLRSKLSNLMINLTYFARLIFKCALLFAVFWVLPSGLAFAEKTIHQLDKPLRIMPLGDSITQSTKAVRSYRYWLWKTLEPEMALDFVGSKSDFFTPFWPDAFSIYSLLGVSEPDDFDQDHEGHWGWTSGSVLEEFEGWFSQSRPDLILIHLGTNDMGYLDGPARAERNVRKIIQTAARINSSVRVLLAQLIPARGGESKISRFNDKLVTLAHDLQKKQIDVQVVDLNTGFDLETMTYDGLHPNEQGAKWMADKWAKAIRESRPSG